MRFWLWHALYPALLFSLAALTVHDGQWDFWVVDQGFDASTQSFPARLNPWVAAVLHKGGRHLIAAIALSALLGLIASFAARWRRWRRGAGYVLACIALTTGTVALGKRLSNVDCPWDVTRYGGTRPHLEWFEPRPASLPRGQCFPGGHSSGAFALFAFYFLWREHHPRRAAAALAGTLALGLVFAGTQWLRGAHFPSHDLWSAGLAWALCLLLHARWLQCAPPVFRGRHHGLDDRQL